MTPQTAKDTIYIDAEDEITVIIDKVRASQSKIIALVLPKRATTLQSIVNLKLLKRTSSEAKKSLVLITSDPKLLPIAGAVGLHVAKTLQTKPAIPSAPKMNDEPINVENESTDPEPELDPHASVGQLAGQLATEETIELDNEVADVITAKDVASKTDKKVSKKLKVPNFDRFRLLVFSGIGLLILLIVGSVFAFIILPKAKITIKTDTTSVSSDLTITAKTDAKSVDAAALVVPAVSKQLKKTDSEKAATTGQRDEGTKAAGSVTITNCNKDQESVTIPAGSILSTTNSGNALAFVTNEAATIAQSNFTGGGVCKNDSFKNVGVTAQSAGAQYNLAAHKQFSIAISGISGTDSTAMAGGTSKLVQIVSQTDIDNAKQKAIDRLNAAAVNEIKTLFTADNATVLSETFAAGEPVVASTPNVGEPSANVTVTVTITFTQLGIRKDNLKQLVETDVKKRIDTGKQVIQDNGLDKAVIRVVDKKSPTEVKFQLQTIVVAGAQLDATGIKKEIAGKKKGETQRIILARPGIKDVDITYSPFWVFSTPKQASHTTIIFEQANAPKR